MGEDSIILNGSMEINQAIADHNDSSDMSDSEGFEATNMGGIVSPMSSLFDQIDDGEKRDDSDF